MTIGNSLVTVKNLCVMKNLRILLLYFVLLYVLPSHTFSQTFIGPVVGYDFQNVLSTPLIFFKLDFKNKGFGNTSPLIGVNLRHKLFNEFYLQVTSDFNHKHVQSIFIGGFTQDLIFHYNYFRNNLLLTYYWKRKWKIGGGITYNFVNNLYFEDILNNYLSALRFNYTEKGGVFILGLKHNKFEFEAYYIKRLSTPPIRGGTIYGYELHQIQSIGLRVSYNFKILDGCKKKELPELQPGNKMAVVE